jgi:hypothetical protein
MEKKLPVGSKNDIREALEYWSNTLQHMLANKFGKNKIGHMIIVFPFGEATECSYISDTDGEGLAMMLHHLADRIENPDTKIIRTH